MALIRLDEEATTPNTPASGKAVLYFNSDGKPCGLNDDGTVYVLSAPLHQYSPTGTTGWETGFETGDEYMRISLDGGESYGPAMRFVGTTGATGGGMTNPMTTGGDIIYGTTGGSPARLAKGTQYDYIRQGANYPEHAPMGSMYGTDMTTGINLATGHFHNGMIICNNATGRTLTIQKNATVAYADNVGIALLNKGAGDLTVQGETGVSINGATGKKVVISQYEMAYLRRLASDTWCVPNFDEEDV